MEEPEHPSPPPYKPPLPHPSKVVPKIALLILALLLFIHLFSNLGRQDKVPHPVRVSLAHAEAEHDRSEILRSGLILPSPLELARVPRAPRFDMPMGSEHGALTYNAQPFRENDHLGADLNGIGGQNSDLGDPVYASGNGRVVFAGMPTKWWGNVVILQHRGEDGDFFQTFYAHLDRIDVAVGDRVHRGEPIGTVGTGNDHYLAHLHLEWRDSIIVDTEAGYAPFPKDREPPEERITALGPEPPEKLNPALETFDEPEEIEPAVEMTAGEDGLKLKKRGSAREPRQ